MFQNLADGLRADRAPGTVGAARRRRNRRLRAFLKHERLTVAMNLATVQHHSHMKSAVVDVCVQVGSPLAPVTEFVAPAPAVTYAAPAPVVGYVAPALAVTYAAPAPVIDYFAPAPSVTHAAPASVFEYVAPAPVLEYIAPAPAVSFVAPSQQLRPAFTAATVTTGVNLDAAVEGSASQVVVSLPHGEVFAAPVFNQVHQEQLAGGEIPENLVEIPVVQKQVIVHASPHVVGSLPPVAEFTSPMYNPVYQEQFSAGDTAENFAIFPVVLEQVLVGMRPERLVDVPGPQGGLERAAPPCTVVPSLSLSSLGDDAGHDVTLTQFLLTCALAQRERERGRGWRRQRLSFSRIAPASIVQWRANGSWRATATPSSSTTVSLSRFLFAFGHNHNSLCSNIVDDAPYCVLKFRGQSSCYWLEPYGSRHRLTFASKDICARFHEVFDEAKRLSIGGAG